MEANLCLPTRHFPVMRHHKNVRVHSSIRLPALQAKVGPPPGAARVAVVGAGVVLACALGAMYWKRARALHLPIHRSNHTSHQGGNGGEASGIVSIDDLHKLLSEICIRKLDPKPQQLTELMRQCLIEKGVKNFSKNQDLTSLLEKKFPKNPGKHEYNLGLVLVLALISEKNYAEANKICNQLIPPGSDAKHDLLLAIINMMMAMESMLQFPENNTSTVDLKQQLGLVEKAWKDYKGKPDFASGIVSIVELHNLLSEICINELVPKPLKLTELINQCLIEKGVKNVSKNQETRLLQENFPKTPGEHDYNLGFVLILALISEKKYAKAKEICNQLISTIPSDSDARPDPLFAIPKDARPDLLLAIINMMMAMESMLQFPNNTELDLKKKLELVENAWSNYKIKADFQAGPPQITN